MDKDKNGEASYVSHPPFITALRDTDGEGIADDRRTLVRGLGFGLDFRGADLRLTARPAPCDAEPRLS